MGCFAAETCDCYCWGTWTRTNEQMIAISACSPTCNRGGIPRISAVFMGSSVRASTDKYGPILVTELGIWYVSGHEPGPKTKSV
ncbi:hypothetical protein RCH12_003676 [Cryobacterium sp. MP_3.1]|nr:hypothetical protein [Cryobacterium sp. MP_3.1]